MVGDRFLGSRTVSRFQSPPHQTHRADFPQWAFLFASQQGLCDVWAWIRFRVPWPPQSVTSKQSQCLVQPFPTPPLPPHPLAFSGTHQVPSHLLLYPLLDQRETSTRIANPKVIYPAPQNRIDSLNHFSHGLANVASEDLPQLCQQRGPLLQLWRIVDSPHPITAANATIFKTQEGETLPLRQIDHPALVLIDLDS